jgi:hypothetical protein
VGGRGGGRTQGGGLLLLELIGLPHAI